MNQAVQQYIQRINNKDRSLTDIRLGKMRLNDADIAPLLLAIKSNPDIAGQILILDFSTNNLTSLAIPSELTQLKTLKLDHNQLSSIDIPSTLVNLSILSLSINKLTSIHIPKQLTALEKIGLMSNLLTSIEIPSELEKLKSLYLCSNKLANFYISDKFNALETLFLTCNLLSNLNLPATLTSLRVLDVNDNKLSTICIPPTCISLRELDVRRNNLTTATLFALLSENHIPNNNLHIRSDTLPLHISTLTPKIIDEHFKLMLRADFDAMIACFEHNSFMRTVFSKLKPELVTNILAKMITLPIPGVERASASMAYFEYRFSRLAVLANIHEHSEALNAYKDNYDQLIRETLTKYASLFKSIEQTISPQARAQRALIRSFSTIMNTRLSDLTPVDPKRNPYQIVNLKRNYWI